MSVGSITVEAGGSTVRAGGRVFDGRGVHEGARVWVDIGEGEALEGVIALVGGVDAGVSIVGIAGEEQPIIPTRSIKREKYLEWFSIGPLSRVFRPNLKRRWRGSSPFYEKDTFHQQGGTTQAQGEDPGSLVRWDQGQNPQEIRQEIEDHV